MLQPKRNNLRATICPVCGHQFSKADFAYPPQKFEAVFEYRDVNFYGGNVDFFSKAKCCREYYLYWKGVVGNMKLMDMEPLDYDAMIRDLGSVMTKEKPKTEPKPEVKEEIVAVKAEFIPRDINKELLKKPIAEMNWNELRKYAVLNGWEYDHTTKKADLLKWVEAYHDGSKA